MNTIIKLSDQDSLVLVPVSSREIAVQVPNFITIKTQTDSNKSIVSLDIDTYEIKIGDIINLNSPTTYGKIPFKVNYIYANNSDKYKYSLFCTKLTKTSIYLTPLLYQRNVFENRTSMLWETNFINCYTGTREEGYLKHLYMVYRFSGDTRYTTFESKLIKHPLFNRRIDLDKYHVMYVFDIKDDDLFEYYCFISGKYSKFTEEYKQKILKFTINPAIVAPASIPNTNIYGILYRTKARKKVLEELIDSKVPTDNELESIPYEDQEIYNGDIEIQENSSFNSSNFEME